MKCLEAILLKEEVHLHPGHGMIELLDMNLKIHFSLKSFASFDLLLSASSHFEKVI